MSRQSVPYSSNSLFRGVPRSLLDEERVVHSVAPVAAGEIIFEDGDPPDYCYLVGEGAVHISKALPSGQQERLATVYPGDFFGELALYDDQPRSARATAAVDSRLGRLDHASFQLLREVAPLQIASNLADRTIERVRETNDRLVSELALSGRLSEVGGDLSNLSHNLRAPLATIHTTAQLLCRMLSNEVIDRARLRKFAEMILRTTQEELDQIDGLMARLRGGAAPAREEVSTSALLRELRSLTVGHRHSPGIIYRDESCAYKGNVVVERSELVAALGNLVKNAVEALPPEGGTIDVSVVAEGRSVVFSVSDTGAGIRPELIPLLFDRDFTHGKDGGTGLGLAHVRAVAERHGGRVYVESEVGRGTTFRLRLPEQLPAGGN